MKLPHVVELVFLKSEELSFVGKRPKYTEWKMACVEDHPDYLPKNKFWLSLKAKVRQVKNFKHHFEFPFLPNSKIEKK